MRVGFYFSFFSVFENGLIFINAIRQIIAIIKTIKMVRIFFFFNKRFNLAKAFLMELFIEYLLGIIWCVNWLLQAVSKSATMH